MSDQSRTALVVGGHVSPIVPQNIEETFRLAGALCASRLVPGSLDTPEKVMVAILAGAELGLPPFQAVQSFAVINGRPSLWGDGLLAVVRAQGFRVREWTEGEGDGMVAKCEVTRPDNDEVTAREFSVSDAKKANLWGKNGPWSQYPKRMLQMRARAFALRDGAADVLRGFQIREEVEDYTEFQEVKRGKVDLRSKLTPAPDGEAQDGFTEGHIEAETTGKRTRKAKEPEPPQEDVQEAQFTETAQETDPEPEAAVEVSGTAGAVSEAASEPEPEPESQEEPQPEPDALPLEAFDAYREVLPVLTSRKEIKQAYVDLIKTSAWKDAEPFEQAELRRLTWVDGFGRLTKEGIESVDPGSDATVFLCWMYSSKDADEIDGTYDIVLARSEAFKNLKPEQQDRLRAMKEERVNRLRG